MRLHTFAELAKHKRCGICVWYSEHLPGSLFKIHIKSDRSTTAVVDLLYSTVHQVCARALSSSKISILIREYSCRSTRVDIVYDS
jgi:hypothetical protein